MRSRQDNSLATSLARLQGRFTAPPYKAGYAKSDISAAKKVLVKLTDLNSATQLTVTRYNG